MGIKKAQPYSLKVISTNAYPNLKTINRYIITAKPLQWTKKGDYKSPLPPKKTKTSDLVFSQTIYISK